MSTLSQPAVARDRATRGHAHRGLPDDRLPRTARRRGRVRAVRAHGDRDARRARQEPHPVRLDAARADRGARGRRLRARDRQARRRALASRSRADQRGDRRGQRRARFDSDGRDRGRRAVVLLRPSSAPGNQPPPRREPGRDLPAVLQARLSRRSRRGSAADPGARVPPVRRPAGPGPVLVDVPMDIFSADLPIDAFQKAPPPIARPTHRRRPRRRRSSTRSRAPNGPCSMPAAACSPPARPRNWRRSPKRSRCPSPTR